MWLAFSIAEPKGKMLRTGVDSIEIERIQTAIERNGDRFLQRVYTAAELEQCAGRFESLAGRFAAKEAVSKALETGIWRHGVNWTDIEVQRDQESGAPRLQLYRRAKFFAQKFHLDEWSISLSHDQRRAIAFVVAIGNTTGNTTSNT